jgi:hypothetical protein
VKSRRRRATVRRKFSAHATVVGFELQAIAIPDSRWEGRADVAASSTSSIMPNKPPSQETERNLNLGRHALRRTRDLFDEVVKPETQQALNA